VADPVALRALGQALLHVAKNPFLFERVKLHTSDGHEYTAMIVADVSEQEWQAIPPAYAKSSVPELGILDNYNDLLKK
jgi:hypothetical protein